MSIVTSPNNTAERRAADDLAAKRLEVAAQLLAAVDTLTPLAAELVRIDRQRRHLLQKAGTPCTCPPAASLAAEVVLAALEPLRPSVPFVGRDSAEQARQRLLNDGRSA